MTHPARTEEGAVSQSQQGYPAYAASLYLPNARAGGVWFDTASAWDMFGQWSRQRYSSRKASDTDTNALYRDQMMLLRDFWTALEKFESELPEEKLPRQERLFDIDAVRRAS